MQTSKKISKIPNAHPPAERAPPTAPKRRSKAKTTVENPIQKKRQISKVSGVVVRPPVETAAYHGHPEDRERDQRLFRELTAHAGESVLLRHRDGLTGTENEEDGVPDDEDALEEAAQKELDAEEAEDPRSDKSIDV